MRKHAVSMHKQAVLIQDVLSFREYIRPFLDSIWEPYGLHGYNYEHAVAYVIRQLIWQNTQSIVTGHEPEACAYRIVFNNLEQLMLRPSLLEVFRHLIRVPVIYGEAELVVALEGRDLTIMYFIPQPLQFT